MANIFARSPYIVSVNETGQVGSKIEIFIWNGTGSAPTTPQYTLSKLIPASNNKLTTYDISPYIREYLRFQSPQNPSSLTDLNIYNWCNVRVKRYKLVGATYTLLNSVDYYALDGYTYYETGSNYSPTSILLEEKTYYYAVNDPAGELNLFMNYNVITNGDYIVYSKPDLSASTTVTISSEGWKTIPRVHSSYTATGNILKVYDDGDFLQATYTFLPICEPKYTPIVVDFVNQFGGWQKEYFFKASKNTLAVESTDFNVMQSSVTNYDVFQGQKKSFNTNAKETIVVNSGFVNEDFSSNLKQLIMSERILVNDRPAICKTKSLEMQKNINNHMINYSLEFEFAYNTINSVI